MCGVCVAFVALVVLDGVMDATVVLLVVSRDANKTAVAPITPSENDIKKHIAEPLKPLKVTLRFPKATVAPLLGAVPDLPEKSLRATEKPHKATTTHSEPLTSHVRFSNSEFAGDRVQHFHVRG